MSPPVLHVWLVRSTHAVNAVAVIGLLLSGIEIFRAAPFYAIEFPRWLSLGGDMKGAIRWHFAFMWVLAANAIVYALARWLLAPRLVPIWPLSLRDLWRDLRLLARLRVQHADTRYNAIQRWLYAGVWITLIVLVLSGAALWKPVQLEPLSALLGGYEATRRVHFAAAMTVLGFVCVHVPMALLVPRTLVAMSVGLRKAPCTEAGL